jgi:hypothetical protein
MSLMISKIMRGRQHWLLTALALCSAHIGFAQLRGSENSPYARYGLGDLLSNTNYVQMGMGNIGQAFSTGFNVNVSNPASYTTLKLTTYEVGFDFRSSTIANDQVKYRTGSASIGYLNIGIPFNKYGALVLGIRPSARAYYHMADTTSIDNFGDAIQSYKGDGGLTKANVGMAFGIKGLRIGANMNYLFGNYNYTSTIEPVRDTNMLSSSFTRFAQYRGLQFDFGVQYDLNIAPKHQLSIGATLQHAQQINTINNETIVTQRAFGSTRPIDTPYTSNDVKGKVNLPLQYGAGVYYQFNKQLGVGIDYTAGQWSEFRNLDRIDSLNNNYQLAIGAQFTPNPESVRDYFQRVTYRLGFRVGKDYVYLRQQDINTFAFTVGASMPIRRSPDRFSWFLEYGQKGTTEHGLLSQKYLKLGLGVSFSDKWFVKRRYD